MHQHLWSKLRAAHRGKFVHGQRCAVSLRKGCGGGKLRGKAAGTVDGRAPNRGALLIRGTAAGGEHARECGSDGCPVAMSQAGEQRHHRPEARGNPVIETERARGSAWCRELNERSRSKEMPGTPASLQAESACRSTMDKRAFVGSTSCPRRICIRAAIGSSKSPWRWLCQR